MRIGRIAFTAEASKSVSWAIFMQSETKNDELRKDSLQEYSSSTAWIEREIITPLQKLDW